MTLPSPRRTRVFVSYSHKDEELVQPLLLHLKGLGDGVVWVDRKEIAAGEAWDREIARGLEATRVAVLVISAAFLGSDYIQDKEFAYLQQAAGEGQLVLVPIHLRECDVPGVIAEIHGVNDPAKPVAALDEAARDNVWTSAHRRIKELLADLILVTVAAEDRDDAEQVLAPLEQKGLRFDLEEYQVADERGLQRRVRTKLEQRRAALLVFGRRGLGLWAPPEMQDAIERARKADLRLISAVLPAAPADLVLPPCLPNVTRAPFPRGLADATTIDRLRTGLTGSWGAPAQPAAPRPATPPQREDAPAAAAAAQPGGGELLIADLVERLAFENLTLFLGSDVAADAAVSAADEKPPLRAYELTQALLEDLDLTGAGRDRLLLPLDVAGTYFAVRKGERSLEFRLCDMLSQRRLLTPLHRALAQLLRTLTELEDAGRFARRGQRPARLIVTTNADLLTERALLLAGVPFVRLVQDRSGEKIVVNVYEEVTSQGTDRLVVKSGEEQRNVRRDDIDGLCEVIAEHGREELVFRGGARQEAAEALQNPLRTLPLERFGPQVFLYKFHGSEDVRNSCAISIDQHLRLIKAVLAKNVVPLKVTEFLASGPVLVFGYGLLDPPFRVLLHTLPLESGAEIGDGARRHYLLQLPPQEDDPDDFRRLEQQLWPKIKEQAGRLGLEVLERRGDTFLGELDQALAGRWGGSDAAHG